MCAADYVISVNDQGTLYNRYSAAVNGEIRKKTFNKGWIR